MFDKNAGAPDDYYIRNKHRESAMPKPVAESHRLAGNLDALGMRVLYKTGMSDQFFFREAIRKMEVLLWCDQFLILMKHKLNNYFTILPEITKLRRRLPRFRPRIPSSSKAEGCNRRKDD